jgi:hypothetical protein
MYDTQINNENKKIQKRVLRLFYHHFSDQHTDFSENHLTSEMSSKNVKINCAAL